MSPVGNEACDRIRPLGDPSPARCGEHVWVARKVASTDDVAAVCSRREYEPEVDVLPHLPVREAIGWDNVAGLTSAKHAFDTDLHVVSAMAKEVTFLGLAGVADGLHAPHDDNIVAAIRHWAVLVRGGRAARTRQEQRERGNH